MRYLLPFLALATPVAAAAQTPITKAEADILVLGSGLPLPPGTPAYGSTIIDRDRLTNEASDRVENVLKDVAGFQQFRRSDSRSANPSAQGVTLRALGGNASSRALVLLDGVPLADPFFGYIPFNALSGDRLSAVRITRGGGAGPFGAGAVAGTIELASATRADLPPYSASAFYGSRDSMSVAGAVSPDVGGGFVTLSGRFERGDGFQTTPRDQRGAATVPARYRDWSIGLRGVAPIDAETDLQFRGLVYDDQRTLRFAGADSTSTGQDASVRLVHRGPWQVDALAYVQARNFSNRVISATNLRLTLDQRNTPSTGLGGKIEIRPPVGPDHVLRIGVDARLGDGELFEDAYSTVTGQVTTRRNAGGRTSTTGLFVEDDWTIGRLVLTGGVRADRWTITDGFFRERPAAGGAATDQSFADRDGVTATGRAGALFQATSAVALRVAGYTGFRLPTLNELYRPFVVFPVTTQANADLGLEKLRGVEAGIDLTPAPRTRIGLTVFSNRLNDAIANVTIGTNLRQRRNVDAVVARGVELTAAAALGQVSFDASYAYSDAEVRGSGESAALDGFVPSQSPRHSGSATIAWTPAPDWLLSGTARYVGKQYEDDLETDVLPDAVTIDAVARIGITSHIAVVARAENLFDETVVTRNQGGSIDLGTPRTLWIGLRLN
ncbi:TonB-dependent receptor [Sphingomonas prati]|uniref:Iron complex outermembrane receptor protein n=1 Tax=Sphingomonas prati TaxID=1843237 RepID=A0A7W9BR09_9SPHN|nr:TonB-dependent receptor [Sphingomonas prati]MBB5728379.1 iron complex outermembrane receptor protein [Sphingomonas prati]GGE74237.1 TonB-dependent receptor [Sphingomonas prati]